MIDVICVCGAKGLAPIELAGRSVRCKKCGGPITIPSSAPASGDAYAIAAEPAPKPKPPTAAEHFQRQIDDRRQRSFWADLAASPTFLAFNVASFLHFIPAFGVAMLGWIGMAHQFYFPLRVRFAVFAGVVMAAAYVGYGLQVIREVAGGEDSLPGIDDMIHDVWESAFKPLLEALAATLYVFAPLIVVSLIRSPDLTTLSIVIDPLFFALAALGAALWPAAFLCIALNGPGILVRPDLIVRTPTASPLGYGAICVMIAGSLALTFAPAYTGGSGAGGFAAHTGAVALGAYLYLVVMRCIGLYYRHFSDELPWSAG